MSKKPAKKKTPLIIEPLDWTAPETDDSETSSREESEKETAKKGGKS